MIPAVWNIRMTGMEGARQARTRRVRLLAVTRTRTLYGSGVRYGAVEVGASAAPFCAEPGEVNGLRWRRLTQAALAAWPT
jgi:hypothetical protein